MPARSICTRSPLNLFNHHAPPLVNNSTNNKDCEKQEGGKGNLHSREKKKVCVVFKDDLKKQKTSLICFAWEKGILVFCSVSVCVLKCASLSVRRSVCSICVQRTGGLLLGCSVFFFLFFLPV